MTTKSTILGMPIAQAISLFTFLIAIISIWVHMEIRIAQINIELTNMKQDFLLHKTDNRKDLLLIRSDIKTDTKEILKRIDEIQIYLRNHRP